MVNEPTRATYDFGTIHGTEAQIGALVSILHGEIRQACERSEILGHIHASFVEQLKQPLDVMSSWIRDPFQTTPRLQHLFNGLLRMKTEDGIRKDFLILHAS